jgi:hypothetical protein
LSGLQGLTELINTLKDNDIIVMLTSVQPKVMKGLKQGGLIDLVGETNVFSSAEHAIVKANEEHIKRIEEIHNLEILNRSLKND